MDAFGVKGLCRVYAECYLNPTTRQHKELDQETATLHRLDLICFFVKVTKPCRQRFLKFRVARGRSLATQ